MMNFSLLNFKIFFFLLVLFGAILEQRESGSSNQTSFLLLNVHSVEYYAIITKIYTTFMTSFSLISWLANAIEVIDLVDTGTFIFTRVWWTFVDIWKELVWRIIEWEEWNGFHCQLWTVLTLTSSLTPSSPSPSLDPFPYPLMISRALC